MNVATPTIHCIRGGREHLSNMTQLAPDSEEIHLARERTMYTGQVYPQKQATQKHSESRISDLSTGHILCHKRDETRMRESIIGNCNR